ncbi:MAG: hypothetical protein U0936_02865 [Planctomycetaceae bacterium]
MTDILGEALQKLTNPDTSPPPEQPHVAMADVAPVAPAAQSATAELSSTAATLEPIVAPNHVTSSPANDRSPLQYLQDHRRQAAAIVVAACVAMFWFDDGTSTVTSNSADGDTAQTDAAEEELMLDEFDAIEVTPKREPAEPAEVASADPFSLTIPQSEPEAVHASGQSAEHPLLQESIGDVRNQSAIQAESTGNPDFPAQQSLDNSPPAIPRSVRFTGRIQPLN